MQPAICSHMKMTHNHNGAVFVVSDPKRGDFQNVLALGQAISRETAVPVEVVNLRCRTHILSALLNVILSRARQSGLLASGRARRVLQAIFFKGTLPSEADPVAVVSTLGRGEAQGAFVAQFWRVPGIHLGRPKRMRRDFFAFVVAHPGDEDDSADLTLPIAPTRITRSAAKKPPDNRDVDRICLLLGGDARGVMAYEDSFWPRCVDLGRVTAQAHQAQIAIITAPRTGPDAEKLILEAATRTGNAIDKMILYGEGANADIAPEVSRCDVIIVTAESISMMSDAIASGARVVAVHNGTWPHSDRVRRFLEHHSAMGTMRVVDLSNWNGTVPPLGCIEPLETSWSELFWSHVRLLFESSSQQ